MVVDPLCRTDRIRLCAAGYGGMNVLLSIHPRFADNIRNGTKQFEYRKRLFRKPVDKVVLYVTGSGRICGDFEIEDILSDKPSRIWEQTKSGAGCSEEYFRRYFRDCSWGHAFQIGSVRDYEIPLRDAYPGIRPPQSFCYLP